MDLAELFNFYGSDKDRNGYTQVYHSLFSPFKDQEINMLEIGIGTLIPGVSSSMVGYALPGYQPGGSLRAWRDFFSKGNIVGVDIQPDTQFTDERITTHLCNTTNKIEADKLMKELQNNSFDIILDDGSHWDLDQLTTLRNLFPYLKENGIYIIEDVTINSRLKTYPNLIASCCNNYPYFFVGVKSNICVIKKTPLNSNRENF